MAESRVSVVDDAAATRLTSRALFEDETWGLRLWHSRSHWISKRNWYHCQQSTDGAACALLQRPMPPSSAVVAFLSLVRLTTFALLCCIYRGHRSLILIHSFNITLLMCRLLVASSSFPIRRIGRFASTAPPQQCQTICRSSSLTLSLSTLDTLRCCRCCRRQSCGRQTFRRKNTTTDDDVARIFLPTINLGRCALGRQQSATETLGHIESAADYSLHAGSR
jgi:hypothetical protein